MQDLMSLLREYRGEILHGSEEGAEFLHMVPRIACFLPQLGDDIQYGIVYRREPAMLFIELVAEDPANAAVVILHDLRE